MTESVALIEGNLPTYEVVQELPTHAEDLITAKALCFKVLLAPHQCTLGELSRLQDLLCSLGYMD
ncbi:unnamed protein product [marine sediment metagenome]|uniref:Uncharacterized protein n=1 Tax=marine sediment metagenome TaxID=412755 RepID=X0YZ14_9ZZZZ